MTPYQNKIKSFINLIWDKSLIPLHKSVVGLKERGSDPSSLFHTHNGRNVRKNYQVTPTSSPYKCSPVKPKKGKQPTPKIRTLICQEPEIFLPEKHPTFSEKDLNFILEKPNYDPC